MKRILSVLLAIVILSVGLTACAASENANNTALASQSASEAAPQSEIKPETQPETQPVPQSGKDEKSDKVVVYSAGPGGLSAGIAEAFEEETGIKVELLQATSGKILSKLEAEKENPVADVVVLATWSAAIGLKEAGMLQAYPEARNKEKLYPEFLDQDSQIFGYSASALGITYNTNLVKNPGKDWNDYTGADWTGKVSLPDPSLSGSCMDFISGYICNCGDEGWQFFNDLKSNEASVDGANKASLETVLTGSKSAVLMGVDYMAYSAKAKGEPVDIVYPTSGTVVNPRGAMILKSSQNVENARLFIDFLLSDKAQDLVKKAYIIPGRSDIKCDNRANMDEISLLKYDWPTMMSNQTQIIEKFASIFQ
ncbi:ABC transporter substrate-binding protein [Fusibacter ferrireducens]|uniref:Extracellular solute-binding protein n=1 Tax=Fusibacter ferrireducens TaxID=2785058 RepID=A0ABR9ZQH5_9FIRM|nr:ABC transporter substrate-binding protein [Fusibacter ferrireducens]MBF4692571.1 extracellular solute-binding protein [Fusibacter ferrireducens]